MTALDYQIRAAEWGISDPRAAIAVYACLGDNPELIEHAGELPQSAREVDPWVLSTILSSSNPMFEKFTDVVHEVLGEEPSKRLSMMMWLLVSGHRNMYQLSRLSKAGIDGTYEMLQPFIDAGMMSSYRDPLNPDNEQWRISDRRLRLYFAILSNHVGYWKRGRMHEILWRRLHARFDRYVVRNEALHIAREWAMSPAAAEKLGFEVAYAQRLLVPDPEAQKLRASEFSLWDGTDNASLLGLGTVRWGLTMKYAQAVRVRKMQLMLAEQGVKGAEEAPLYCVGTKFDRGVHELAEEGKITLIQPADFFAEQPSAVSGETSAQ